jgi:hypothetical protein
MQIKTCAKCGESRPLNDFTYLATYAQSKAWGRAGNVRMELESKNCKDCRPKRKPPMKLSAKEIHNRVQTGDMNAGMAKHLREKQAQDERNKQAMASRKRWLKTWRVELRTALAPITREIISARNAYEYAKDKGYVDKAEFYFRYHAILKHEKAHVEYSHMTSPRRPQSARWADYLSPMVFTMVREMWASLPPIFKHTGKIPLLITYRPEMGITRGQTVRKTEGESK